MNPDPATTVGFGVPYADPNLDVPCGRCAATVGQSCTRRGGGSHASRQDKATRKQFKAADELAMQLEQAALHADPDGPLWRAAMTAHLCGVHGAHRLADCRAVEVVS